MGFKVEAKLGAYHKGTIIGLKASEWRHTRNILEEEHRRRIAAQKIRIAFISPLIDWLMGNYRHPVDRLKHPLGR